MDTLWTVYVTVVMKSTKGGVMKQHIVVRLGTKSVSVTLPEEFDPKLVKVTILGDTGTMVCEHHYVMTGAAYYPKEAVKVS